MNGNEVLLIFNEIKKLNYKPSEWEKGFLGNILCHKKISNKQAQALQKIYEKATGGGVFQRKEYIR